MLSFEWNKPVPPEWQADLDRLSPGDRVSRLVLAWLAGFPYEPVQRWAIYEITPAATIHSILEQERVAGAKNSLIHGVWNDLQGPDPRTTGEWRDDHRVIGGKRWVSKSMVSRTQWDVHQQTGGFPVLCWIIEGDHGGHSWQFGQFEQGFLLEAGAAPDDVQRMGELWPNPGEKAYAPYDQRVFNALAERDLLRDWRMGMAWDDRAQRTTAGLILEGDYATRKQRTMDRMMKWLDNQIGEAISDIPRRMLPQWSDFTDAAPLDTETIHNNLKE